MNFQKNKYGTDIVKTRHPLDIKAVICAATITVGILHIIL